MGCIEVVSSRGRPAAVTTAKLKGVERPAWVLTEDRRLMVFSLVGTSAFALVGVALLATGEGSVERLAGAFVTLTFGTFAFLRLSRLASRKGPRQLTMTATSLAWTPARSQRAFSWDSIEAMSIFRSSNDRSLRIRLDEGVRDQVMHGVPRSLRRLESLGDWDMVIPLSTLGVDAERLQRAIGQSQRDPSSRQIIGTRQGLAVLGLDQPAG